MMSASRQSFGSSRAKLRLRIKTPAKANTIHNRPPENCRVSSDEGSNAKLKISRMTSANESAELIASLLRSSERRSLCAIVSTPLTPLAFAILSVKIAWIGEHLFVAGSLPDQLAALQKDDVRRELESLTQLVS